MGKGITEAGHRLNFLVQHHIVTKEVKTMAMPVQHSKIADATKVISEQGFQGMAEVMQLLMNEAMQVERARYLQAEPYQ
jgi:hypothetical protein